METAHYRAFKSSQKLSRIYAERGYGERARKVGACGKTYSFYVCHGCGEFCYLAEFRCDDRLCALCGRARVARLLESYGGVLKGVKNAKMVTVSMRSRPVGELKQAVKELWDAFTRLRHRVIWKTVKGSIASLEITFNGRDRTWHPHLHILVDSQFMVWENLRDAWIESTAGEGRSVYIQKARAGWECELIKYITKVSELFKSGPALDEFLTFSRGRRFIRTYGTLYNCAVNREETSAPLTCRGCGQPMTVEKQCVSIQSIYDVTVSSGLKVVGGDKLSCFLGP